MVSYLTLISVFVLAVGVSSEKCSEEKCKLPNCRCSGTSIPGNLDPKDVPQMVLLVVDNLVTKLNFERFFKTSLFNRQNPNGCNISATFFITNDLKNDYEVTYQLYRQGHEIGLHSITHRNDARYWIDANVEKLELEYIGQRDILNKFGLIPKESIKGVRAPNFMVVGDKYFEWIERNNIQWDSSWPNNNGNEAPIWPYTLEYDTDQKCTVPICPKESHPGIWEVPVNDWKHKDGKFCSIPDQCPSITGETAVFEFFKSNFLRHYESNRVPLMLTLHEEWFDQEPRRYNAYIRFLDYLRSLHDVYLVSVSQMLQWVRNPTPLLEMKDFWKYWIIPVDECRSPTSCNLKKLETRRLEELKSCVTSCPSSFPGLGNPLGEKA